MASATDDQPNIYQHISRSSNKFCGTFYSNVAARIIDNVACSPLSTHIILSLVAYGSRGKTADELKSGLYLTSEDSLEHNGFKTLLDALNNVTDIELNVANNIYIQENLSIVPDFLTINSKFFYSITPTVDFKDSIESSKQINSWVEEKTNNKIKDVISADDLNESTKIVLVNAIYFKGNWEHPFDVTFTEHRPFYISKDTKRHVPTMFKKHKYAHGKAAKLNSRIIELPYSNNNFSMLIILPNEIEGLRFLEKNFKPKSLKHIEWKTSEVEVYLPKFKVESTIDLEDSLTEMGMGTMFSDLADLTGVAQGPLKVSKIVQKAFIEINEKGCEAAAATVIQIRLRRMVDQPEIFKVDRPFMFTIQHKPSNIPIFVGSIRDLQLLRKKDEL
ncbi:antichymotrypsin-2-like isoform X2 [Athalia rosae]|nr:antichymotrypsin-2-like isoform X2 [Athalia rosae]